MPDEFLVMGSWAVHRVTGKLRHRPCSVFCSAFNNDNKDYHDCSAVDEDAGDDDVRVKGSNGKEYQRRHIPAIVRHTARTLQETHNQLLKQRKERWYKRHPGKPYLG